MAFLSMDDAEFWEHFPKKMGHVVGGGLSGIATFILGKTKDNPPRVPATIRWGLGHFTRRDVIRNRSSGCTSH